MSSDTQGLRVDGDRTHVLLKTEKFKQGIRYYTYLCVVFWEGPSSTQVTRFNSTNIDRRMDSRRKYRGSRSVNK